MLTATCHCGAVRLQIPRKPRQLTDCNCSICRRYGTKWAYFKQRAVRFMHARGATSVYSWGRKELRFVRCKTCGCIMYWEAARKAVRRRPDVRCGINARNLEPEAIASVRVRRLDGAKTWKFLD